MSREWIEAVAKAVAKGETESQFAIPDGKYVGDLFFITNAKNMILMAFVWTGDRWMHEHEQVVAQIDDRQTDKQAPAGFKPVTAKMAIRD